MTDEALIDLQVDALFVHDEQGRMLRNNEPGDWPAPWVFRGRGGRRQIWRFRAGTPHWAIRDPEATASALIATGARVDAGPAFVFDDAPSRMHATAARLGLDDLPKVSGLIHDWAASLAAGRACAGIIENGAVVSVCCSSRQTDRAAEAGVATLPAYRGRGFAVRAVATWAAMVQERGLIALYSTSWTNEGSRRVAARLGLRMYGDDFGVH